MNRFALFLVALLVAALFVQQAPACNNDLGFQSQAFVLQQSAPPVIFQRQAFVAPQRFAVVQRPAVVFQIGQRQQRQSFRQFRQQNQAIRLNNRANKANLRLQLNSCN